MAKQSLLSPEMLAAFAAKGGKVTRAAEGEGLGLTARQWYRASRDQEISRVVEDCDLDAAISEREHEIGAAHGIAGVNDFRAGIRKHGTKAMLGWE